MLKLKHFNHNTTSYLTLTPILHYLTMNKVNAATLKDMLLFNSDLTDYFYYFRWLLNIANLYRNLLHGTNDELDDTLLIRPTKGFWKRQAVKKLNKTK